MTTETKDQTPQQKYYYKNRAKILEYHKEYYAQNRKAIIDYVGEWQKTNKDKLNENARKRYVDNKEAYTLYQKEYRRRNADKIKQMTVCKVLKRHAEVMANDPEHLTTDFLKSILKVECK